MIETGLLNRSGQKVNKCALEESEKGFQAAGENSGTDRAAVVVP